MELLYISALSSERLINEIHERTKSNPGYAVQKFSRLLVKGFLVNDVKCSVLSNPPISSDYAKDKWINLPEEFENGVEYRYIPFINIPLFKHLCIMVYTFFYVLHWGLRKTKHRAIICDTLCISTCLGAILASKCCGLKSVGVVTDIYGLMVGEKPTGMRKIFKGIGEFISRIYIRFFSCYVLLTEAMNDLVNSKKRPYIVMEALCDASIKTDEPHKVEKDTRRVILYAGGLEEKYGLKMLVDAFKSVKLSDVELHLYGSGLYVPELLEECKKDYRIKYWGVRPNEEVVQALLRATLLVNPRPTAEEFTKYSFPSKNMEYMVSGTPLLTTKLPGMPHEYLKYIFLFEQETREGYSETLNEILECPESELTELGEKARSFVLEYKNNVFQSRRVVKLIDGIL